jgi:hypothetical protein
MPYCRGEFAIVKPAFGGQENKDEDKNAQNIVLPGGSAVAPEKDAFQTTKKEAHTTLHLSDKQIFYREMAPTPTAK